MGRLLKPPTTSKAAALEAAQIAALPTGHPKRAVLLERAAHRAERAARFEAQTQRLAQLEAKALAKAQAKAKREASAQRKAGLEARRQARAKKRTERELAQVQKMERAGARMDAAYLRSERKREAAVRRENRAARVEYEREIKTLLETNPWRLVYQQQDILDIAHRRKTVLIRDERSAKAVMGDDDPETILEWKRMAREAKSAINSWQTEKRKLQHYTLVARAFDETENLDLSQAPV